MESDVGTPIEYNPNDFSKQDNFQNEHVNENENEPERDEQYYVPPQQMYPAQQQMYTEKSDIFANLDKTGYVIIFVAFLLGFFMGKTMQPVILRPG